MPNFKFFLESRSKYIRSRPPHFVDYVKKKRIIILKQHSCALPWNGNWEVRYQGWPVQEVSTVFEFIASRNKMAFMCFPPHEKPNVLFELLFCVKVPLHE